MDILNGRALINKTSVQGICLGMQLIIITQSSEEGKEKRLG